MRQAADQKEIKERQAADKSEGEARRAADTAEASARQAGDADTLQRAKDLTDASIARYGDLQGTQVCFSSCWACVVVHAYMITAALLIYPTHVAHGEGHLYCRMEGDTCNIYVAWVFLQFSQITSWVIR